MYAFHLYRPEDKEGCLEVIDDNIPQFFSPYQRISFDAYLEQKPEHFYVLKNYNGRIVACGGYSLGEPGDAQLEWSVVSTDYRHMGLGQFLLFRRLEYLCAYPEVLTVHLTTSHRAVGFFQQYGFSLEKIYWDYHFPGLHRQDLVLYLDGAQRDYIRRRMEGHPLN